MSPHYPCRFDPQARGSLVTSRMTPTIERAAGPARRHMDRSGVLCSICHQAHSCRNRRESDNCNQPLAPVHLGMTNGSFHGSIRYRAGSSRIHIDDGNGSHLGPVLALVGMARSSSRRNTRHPPRSSARCNTRHPLGRRPNHMGEGSGNWYPRPPRTGMGLRMQVPELLPSFVRNF